MSRSRSDSFTLEIIQHALIAAAEETFVAFGRTSKSPVIYEVLDYACGLTDKKGQLVAQANGVPGFLGTLDMAVKEALIKFGPDEIYPGDIVITNIPYTTGTHLNDVTLIMPIFHRDELIGFSANKGHWTEVGGMHFGSWTPDATEIYQEGLQFPSIKLYEKGRPNQVLIELIKTNVRTPDMTLGDMEAQAASLRVGAKRVTELCEKYGREVVLDAIDSIIKRGEELIKLRLAEMPHGMFEAEDHVDDDGVTDSPLYVKVKVKINSDSFIVDFTGSADQAKGSINSPWCATVSGTRSIMKAVTDPHTPANEGNFRPLKVIAPPGSVFHPTSPAPTSTYWESMGFVTDLVWKALAPHVPDKLTAGHFLSVCATILGGVNDVTKEAFGIVEPQAGGWGAGLGKDGENGLVCSADGETYIMSNEVIEVRHPILVNCYRINIEDGVGEGKFRGGFGLVKEYKILNSRALFTASFGRSKFPPWGMAGGGEGSPNYFQIIQKSKTTEKIRKVAAFTVHKGDIVRLTTGGGGGYGDPLERNPEAVALDVRNGYITREEARRVYGVSLAPRGSKVDHKLTKRIRNQRHARNL